MQTNQTLMAHLWWICSSCIVWQRHQSHSYPFAKYVAAVQGNVHRLGRCKQPAGCQIVFRQSLLATLGCEIRDVLGLSASLGMEVGVHSPADNPDKLGEKRTQHNVGADQANHVQQHLLDRAQIYGEHRASCFPQMPGHA